MPDSTIPPAPITGERRNRLADLIARAEARLAAEADLTSRRAA